MTEKTTTSEASRNKLRNPSPFRDLLGIAVPAMCDGYARVVLPSSESLQNAHGTVHGGAIATLVDVAAAMAANSVSPFDLGVVTVSMTTNFLNAGRGGLIAEARVLSAGRSIVSVKADISDGAGQPIATALATLKFVRPRAADTTRT